MQIELTKEDLEYLIEALSIQCLRYYITEPQERTYKELNDLRTKLKHLLNNKVIG